MGFLDDSDSELDESCMSCSAMSMSFPRGGLSSYGRRAAADEPSKPFKFGWDDSGISSVCTEDLEASLGGFGESFSSDRHQRDSKPSPLGKLLEQVDGVGYNLQKEKPRGLLLKDNKPVRLGGLYGGQDDSDSEEEEEDLLPPRPVEVTPEPELEPEREITIRFVEPLVTDQLEFVQEEDAALAVWDEHHVAEDHNQIPWDEEYYEELPWHLQPDLDEDDELTKRCKQVIPNKWKDEEEDDDEVEEDEQEEVHPLYQRRVDRVEALVIQFVLSLKYKRLDRKARSSLNLAGGEVFKANDMMKQRDSETVATEIDSSTWSSW